MWFGFILEKLDKSQLGKKRGVMHARGKSSCRYEAEIHMRHWAFHTHYIGIVVAAVATLSYVFRCKVCTYTYTLYIFTSFMHRKILQVNCIVIQIQASMKGKLVGSTRANTPRVFFCWWTLTAWVKYKW